MTKYKLSTGVEHLMKELTVAARVMQNFSDECNTAVSDEAKWKQTKLNTYTFIPELTLSLCLGLEACH